MKARRSRFQPRALHGVQETVDLQAEQADKDAKVQMIVFMITIIFPLAGNNKRGQRSPAQDAFSTPTAATLGGIPPVTSGPTARCSWALLSASSTASSYAPFSTTTSSSPSRETSLGSRTLKAESE
ncbi:hypothetical protein BBBOND_0102010 [Babesia bigemina]|uniref:Uncharacterized protein n=1 Tax=Babesia bigemina TaxID=5866 RepID=A0A061D193_BABBI|nr:hypothetical protein BBBOND_0102010 [Babesia bigemina]CDR93872.1 hypothetical protein BBBOND_0102010 [Babesia bigemina]|eukprot:XP_012766058.1 hypothetical protein BBBOND_0102010 [Babesia bigemina]